MKLPGFTHENTLAGTHEWYTPEWVFKALNIEFDLDPASPGAAFVPWIPARKHYTLEDNGLLLDWTGSVWLNPPYGDQTSHWLAKFINHGNGIALVFSRTDTGWFHETATKCNAICFMRRRVSFIKSDGTKGGSPGCGSMLLACGKASVDALQNSGLGPIWKLK